MNDLVQNPELWMLALLPGGKDTIYGKIDPRSPVNAYLMLKNHEEFRGKMACDVFADRCLFLQSPPWEDASQFKVRKIDDRDAFMASLWLENHGVKQPKQIAMDALLSVARDNQTNPAQEYFEGIKDKWDGKKRLATWLCYYLGAESQPAEYLEAVGTKWLVAIVSRAFEPGTKFDHVLVLEGAQGLGKSAALRELATFGEEIFFYDGQVSFADKDTLMALQGKMIVEMAEMASFKKAENEEIKAFISRTRDEYRAPYGRTILERPRYYVLTGSTNEKEYLPPDESGHRRIWPAECGRIDMEALKADREQLWAEAATLYHGGYPTWVLPEQIEMFTLQQESRVIKDAWFDLIGKFITSLVIEHISVDEIFEKLEIKPRDRNNATRKRIKDTLRYHNWYETKDPVTKSRAWRKKEVKEDSNAEPRV